MTKADVIREIIVVREKLRVLRPVPGYKPDIKAQNAELDALDVDSLIFIRSRLDDLLFDEEMDRRFKTILGKDYLPS